MTNKQIIKILDQLGFQKISQRGSHIKFLRFHNSDKQILIIPNHKQIAIGTVKEIYNQLSFFIAKEDLYTLFYK